jgi:hypothetical protein
LSGSFGVSVGPRNVSLQAVERIVPKSSSRPTQSRISASIH